MVNSPNSDSSSVKSTSSKRSTPTPKNAFDHAEYLYKKNLIDQEHFGDILLKIKENGNQKEWCNDYVQILSSLCEKSNRLRNIMLDENYNCKVIDFGDAKKVDEPPIEDEPLPEEEKKEDEFPQ